MAQTNPNDLAVARVIADTDHSDTFRLGPAGMYRVIHVHAHEFEFRASGDNADASRQNLFTVVSAAGNPALAVDDVSFGVVANSGKAPSLAFDARQAFGSSVPEAGKDDRARPASNA